MTEAELAERLHRIQALFAGAATEGERAAAAAAKERVEARLNALKQEARKEYRFALDNPWSRRLLMALLQRHGIQPYRHRGQRRTTIMARMSESFLNEVFGPEFTQLNDTLAEYLDEVASRVIAKVVHANQADEAVVESGASLEASA